MSKQDVKNGLALSGRLDATFAGVMQSTGPDETRALITELAHSAVDAAWGAQQARIDALMLEYCPDEMTSEQKEEWGRHQKPYVMGAGEQQAMREALRKATRDLGAA